MSSITPVERGERISSIDVLRGVALLGILLMNIQDFGLPGAAYWNPTLWGGAGGADLGYWFANQVLFEGKMRTIFSMLFGAGFLVLTGRAEARGLEGQAQIADVYYRRTMWLMAFGVLHAYFIWWGDILFPYAFFGLFLFPLRRLSPKALIGLGVFLLAIRMPFAAFEDYEQRELRAKGEAAIAEEKSGRKLTWQQEEDKKKWEERRKELLPDAKKIQKDINDHRLGYWSNFRKRADTVTRDLSAMFTWVPTDVGGMMLIGMGLMKLGVFTGQLATGAYVRLMLAGYLLGAPVNAAVAWWAYHIRWDPLTPFPWWLSYDFGRLTVGLGHIGLVMIVCRKGWLGFLTRRLQAVGQMALTNYLLTSLLCTFFFNGYGLGFFGKLARHQLLFVAAGVWTVNLVLSPWWLARYRFGPAEWLWRSLTYWQPQPMRLVPKEGIQAAHA